VDEYKSRLSAYLSDMVREELEKYDGGFTDEWNDQRKKNAEVLGYKLSGKSDIKEGATEFWQDMFRPGNIPNKYINQLIKKKGELPSKSHIKSIYKDNGNPSSSQLSKAFKQLAKEKYIRKQGSMWKWESGFAWRTGTELESVNEGFTKYHIRLTDTPGWYGVWDKKGKQKFEGDKRYVMKHLKKLKTRMGNYQLKSLIDVATKRKGKDITFDVVESVNESGILYKAGVKKYGKEGMAKILSAAGKKKSHAEIGAIKDKYEKESLELDEAGMGILDSDQADILQGIVLRNKNKNLKGILNVALKSGHFKGVDKKELLGYIDGAKQFVKYMKSHPMESINEAPKDKEKIKDEHKKEFFGALKQMTKNIKKIHQYAKSNHWGMVSRFVDNGLVYDIRDVEREIEALIRMGEGITEDTKRDYKAEYKKYGSSTKAKKYRAELNQYNRKKGTYGNGDGKDASHKGGKIAGFEKESTNRGRREKSRLKKEDIREFSGDQGINVYLGGIVSALHKSGIKPKTAKQMKHGFSKSRDKIGFFIDVLDRKREKYTLQLEIDRDGYLWYLSAPKDMKLGKWADESKVVRSLKAISKLPDFGQSSLKRR
jgi:hypothetical protein